MAMSEFTFQWQSLVATETPGLRSLKYLLPGLLQKRMAAPGSRLRHRGEGTVVSSEDRVRSGLCVNRGSRMGGQDKAGQVGAKGWRVLVVRRWMFPGAGSQHCGSCF